LGGRCAKLLRENILMASKQLPLDIDGDMPEHDSKYGSKVSLAARLVTQGRYRFYTLTMPSDVLAETCVVDTREEKPDDGFQRVWPAPRKLRRNEVESVA